MRWKVLNACTAPLPCPPSTCAASRLPAQNRGRYSNKYDHINMRGPQCTTGRTGGAKRACGALRSIRCSAHRSARSLNLSGEAQRCCSRVSAVCEQLYLNVSGVYQLTSDWCLTGPRAGATVATAAARRRRWRDGPRRGRPLHRWLLWLLPAGCRVRLRGRWQPLPGRALHAGCTRQRQTREQVT